METDAGRGCVQPDGALLAEFRTWLDRERGLSPVSVRCYSKQSKAFLAGIGGAGAVSELDAGRVTAFMVDWTQGRNTWSAKAMVTSLRAFLRFAHATGRTAVPLAGAVPAVASWRLSSCPAGLKAAEIERLLAGCDRDTAAGLRDYAVLSLLARLGPARRGGRRAALGDIDWRAGEIAVRGKGSKSSGSRCRPRSGRRSPPGWSDGRPQCESRSVFVTVRRALPAADAGVGPGRHGPGLRAGRPGAAGRPPAPALAGDRDAAGRGVAAGGRAGAAAPQPAVAPRSTPRSTRTRCARWPAPGRGARHERAAGQGRGVPGDAPGAGVQAGRATGRG